MNYEVQKRILDIVVASILLVGFLPFWIVIPLLIYFDSGWPVFFVHERMGKDGKPIKLFKFRSMIQGADDLLHKKDRQLLKKFKAGDWKLENDPRITKLGKVLRSLTIDEFPQLLNVLRGEMSMVGPRAYVRRELDDQTDRYPETKELIPVILSVKPGITGPWQVSGRNDIPFVQRAQLDADYARQRSIWNDILILLKTPRAMISRW
ncbi:sugar transferase [Candidatus Woesebacteria bacterium]|nr:sugar transferase [Candidatus Woesebacteria bacterium]MCD8507095.1 sugar transferase [Candidatus Woesebacteria bacterium]MCD8546082.1 sugar transferase [Candidatus Woesebacteria bacterium]